MKLDTKTLRELAAAATPGPWTAEPILGWNPNDSHIPRTRVTEEHDRQIADCFDNTRWSDDRCEANAAFIAACSPDVVTALLDKRDATTVTVDGLVYGEHMIRQLRVERDAMRANYDRLVAKARQFERYPGGEGARVELRSALDALGQLDDDRKEHDWLACPDCRALSKSGHEPPRCDVFMANERAAKESSRG